MQPYNGDGDLIVSINKALELEDWSIATRLMESDEITEATVIDSNKGGLLVRFGRLTGFVPNSHIESVPPATPQGRMREIKDQLVGKKLGLKVIQVETKRNRLILSERAARRAARSERLGEIEIGQIIPGRVVNLTDFGAFVDIGGVDGMIHISNIDHRHVNHPSDILAVGDEVMVRVDSVDIERERIALNRKAVLPDPWQSFIESYNEGQLMEGVVTNVVDFGVFVAAPGGAQGLVHTSRMASLVHRLRVICSAKATLYWCGLSALIRHSNILNSALMMSAWMSNKHGCSASVKKMPLKPKKYLMMRPTHPKLKTTYQKTLKRVRIAILTNQNKYHSTIMRMGWCVMVSSHFDSKSNNEPLRGFIAPHTKLSEAINVKTFSHIFLEGNCSGRYKGSSKQSLINNLDDILPLFTGS
ncbi:MAG: S1 RNA-binding domain-containing protein [Anaerolineae bacterium]|nr:S1 RNA-binding domain-containing protein [Anaerolineae bacterium]